MGRIETIEQEIITALKANLKIFSDDIANKTKSLSDFQQSEGVYLLFAFDIAGSGYCESAQDASYEELQQATALLTEERQTNLTKILLDYQDHLSNNLKFAFYLGGEKDGDTSLSIFILDMEKFTQVEESSEKSF